MSTEDTTSAMHQLADHYASELDAQFRTLNLFVDHAGEIGRAHEAFLSGLLSRFLPKKLSCGTGFIARSDQFSKQQDIIIYDQISLPLLFKVGECLVVDGAAALATIEVKTKVTSQDEFSKAFDAVADAKEHSPCASLFMWEGPTRELAEKVIWDKFRAQQSLSFSNFPDAIYSKGRYLLIPNKDGAIDTQPMRIIEIGDGKHKEGTALFTFLHQVWIAGLQAKAEWPKWLERWAVDSAVAADKVKWPDDLLKRALSQKNLYVENARKSEGLS